jgi:hypothetical protein
MTKIFPTILIILDVAAAMAYLVKDGDVRKTIYWLAAAILTIVVTY